MKVAFLLTQDRGGPVDLTVGLANELAGRPDGPEITVLGPPSVSCAGEPWSLLRPVQVRSKIDARGFAAVAKVLEKVAPDIIHAQNPPAALLSALVSATTPPFPT